MDTTRAHTVLALLADGVHPLTGEIFPADSPYQQPEVVRALYCALRFLESQSSSERAAGLPSARSQGRETTALVVPAVTKGNAGKPWSADEERELLERFDAGTLPADLAKQHGRSVAGIEARLEKLGRLRPDQRTTTSRYPYATSATPAKSTA